MKVLIIEDSQEITESVALIFQLRWPGATAVHAGTGEKGVEMVETESPDVVILDIALPDMNGFEVLRQIRRFSDVAVVLLTGQATQEIDKIKGFEMGADDYIVKPFSPGEFLARVKNALRHSQTLLDQADSPPLTAGNLVIDFASRQVFLKGEPVKLTPTEYRLLCHLARNAGRVLSFEDILGTVWGEGYTTQRDILKVCIYQLRQKLTEAGAAPEMIVSERGVGYKFVTPI